MTDKEPNKEELEKAGTDVEGHGVDEGEEGEAGWLDANVACA